MNETFQIFLGGNNKFFLKQNNDEARKAKTTIYLNLN